MSWADLVPKSIELLTSYNPITDSPDTHFQNNYKSTDDPNEKMFMQQIFYGVNRYRDFLKRLNRAIFKVNATSTNSNDSFPFMIIAYIVSFRLDELGVKHFRKIIDTQEPLKMHVLLQFLLNEEMLREHVCDSWCEIYDFEFVENIITKNGSKSLELADLLDYLSNKATGHGTIIKEEEIVKEKKFTIPKPFNLTKPKPRKLPKYLVLERKVVVNPVQDVIYKNSLQQVAEANEERRNKVKEQTLKKYSNE
ncbi:hypothetical protein SteCoe_23642 [Stentor coeruleus]|uniref:Uncharacterized protein n=1 Tax=Stentor coeruleus TaxID=5963 RepID=A0A1R2BJD6_9CILI|nr:hypothetical protein SteCoe_23642 [Stentor coeruleus]